MAARLTVVGLGPGDAGLLAPLARQALARAEAVVGYGPYLDYVEPELLAGKEVFASGMTREVERVERAVELARSGRETAVVSSGDAGVYGMAGLVLELLAARGWLEEIETEVVPGIPALCAAAALLGAPLMHDFAAVSLSDLLTPLPLIRRRVACAAAGDFVIVLYNPRSKRRADYLAEALAVIGESRPGTTPVGMVKNAYRPGQATRLTTLAEADPGWADMLTIVVVGNSSSLAAGGRMITPRGYAGKYDLGDLGGGSATDSA